MAVVRERRGVMQRSASIEIDRVGGFWKPPCQIPKSGIKYSTEWRELILPVYSLSFEQKSIVI